MRCLSILSLTFALASCGEVLAPPPATGSFTLEVDPGGLFVRQGETHAVEVRLARTELDAAVDVVVAGLPTGVTAMPLTIAETETTGMLTLVAAGDATQGDADLEISGTAGEVSAEAPAALRLLVGGAPGTLDLSFGDAGRFTPPLNNMALASRGLARAGNATIATGFVATSPFQAITVKVTDEGALDPTFGNNGFVSTGAANGAEGIAVTTLADGSVLVAGIAGGASASDLDFGLFAYDPAGTLVSGFGTGGIASFDPGTGFGELHTVGVEAGGSIVVTGTLFGMAGGSSTRGLRYSATGVRDPTFDITEPNAFVEAAVLQADGKLVMVGGLSGDFWIARYTPAGLRDPGFSAGNVVTVDFAPDTATAFGLAIVPGNKLLVAGIATQGTNRRLCLAQLNPNGSPDATFGSGGKLTTTTPFDSRSPNAMLAVGASFLMVGVVGGKPAVVRFRADGSIDDAFGVGGVAEIDFGIAGTTSSTGGFGITADPDGRILVSADVGPAGGQRLAIARLWP